MRPTLRRVRAVLWPAHVLIALTLVTGCDSGTTPAGTSASGTNPSSGGYTIVTTTGMVNDIVRQVAGERAEVTGIMGTGVDPHLYKPTASDNAKLRAADVIFYSGLLLEGRMDEVLKTASERGKPVYAVTEGIDPAYVRHPPGFAGHPDPHVWGDVTAWSAATAYVAEKLAEFDPPHAEEYRQNAERYRAKLAELDAYVRQVIASIPEGQRHLVTAHDAFEYFSHAYGIPVQSVLGITTESEAGVDDINQLVDFLVENKVPAVFIESSVNSRNIEAVIEGAAQRGWTVRIGGELFSDAMGAPGTYEGTYIGMIDHNATVIARALGGSVPEGGFRKWTKSRNISLKARQQPTVEVLGVYSLNDQEQLVQREIDSVYSAPKFTSEYREAIKESLRERLDSTVLIEVMVRNRDDQFDAGDFTQDSTRYGSSQVAYSEAYLTLDGESVIDVYPFDPPEGQTLRVAFFHHEWDSRKALFSSYGRIRCPPPQPMSQRLAKLVPYVFPG